MVNVKPEVANKHLNTRLGLIISTIALHKGRPSSLMSVTFSKLNPQSLESTLFGVGAEYCGASLAYILRNHSLRTGQLQTYLRDVRGKMGQGPGLLQISKVNFTTHFLLGFT